MAVVPAIRDTALQAICDVLGDTATGLTGSEIGRYLAQAGIEDPIPHMTKRHRLFQALKERQDRDKSANHVLRFISVVMDPVKHIGNKDYFESERHKLNLALSFCGIHLTEQGTFKRVDAATTLSDAEQRAGTLRKALQERRVHPDVLAFCRAELIADDYFHAVFEATKSVAEKLRNKTGLTADGAPLVDEALSLGKAGHPRLAFNSLQTESERSEQSGLANLIKGIFGAFRNTTGHAPRIHWHVTEQDALDVLTTLSLIHRRLDAAVRTHIP